MRSRRISKWALASPGGTIMVGIELPSPVIVPTSFGEGRAVAGDGYEDSGLSTRATAATVIQYPRVPRQDGGYSFKNYVDGKREVLKPRFLGPGIVSIKDASLALLVKAGNSWEQDRVGSCLLRAGLVSFVVGVFVFGYGLTSFWTRALKFLATGDGFDGLPGGTEEIE
ncbi:hypothetical protein AVEN_61259-1 [Araneus ventricosus]|uniref:Uncharacterized protein n=1 Tax=Araneus ventricosus TaxID=182803 RepID=A0A4Y2T3T7_ARAVE|nr:hypothetical protein AVEN_61259-1 [Araneus ventricosus]